MDEVAYQPAQIPKGQGRGDDIAYVLLIGSRRLRVDLAKEKYADFLKSLLAGLNELLTLGGASALQEASES